VSLLPIRAPEEVRCLVATCRVVPFSNLGADCDRTARQRSAR
jgi:hypothetical protein